MGLFDFLKTLGAPKKARKKAVQKIKKHTKSKPKAKVKEKTSAKKNKPIKKKPAKKTTKKIKKKTSKKTKKISQKKIPAKTKKKPGKKSTARKSKKISKPLKKITQKPKEKEIGIITHHFAKISVGIIKLKGLLTVGDKIHIKGAHDDFTQVVKSIQINHKDALSAKKGAEVGIKVSQPVHENDRVYKIG